MIRVNQVIYIKLLNFNNSRFKLVYLSLHLCEGEYNSNIDIIKSNLILRHKALLYRFTPAQLIEEMKKKIEIDNKKIIS